MTPGASETLLSNRFIFLSQNDCHSVFLVGYAFSSENQRWRSTREFAWQAVQRILRVTSLTNSVAKELEASSPHSQQPATDPCTEPVESNPHPQANLRKIHSDPIFPPTTWSSPVVSFLRAFPPKPCTLLQGRRKRLK
jgi:hypothetical protein